MTVGRTDCVAMPGRKWYWVAGAVGVICIVAFVVYLYDSISGMGDAFNQMLAPGLAEFAFAEPGTYTVFHEYESVFKERYYSSPEIVSGLKVQVASSGAVAVAVAVRAARTNLSYQMSGRAGKSIFEFEIVEPGPYRVTADYTYGRHSPEVVLAIGHDFMGKLLTTIFGAFAIMFVGLGGAGVITVVTYLKRKRAVAASMRSPS